MRAKIIGGKDKEQITGKIGKENEHTVFAKGIAFKISHHKYLNYERQHKGNRQPHKWRALEQDQEDTIDDTRDNIHDERDLHGNAKKVPAKQGEGNTFDKCNQQI